ncbi:hypothetical protein [Brachybacterium nesterenkovii]|uniref:Uncharacterized protein n=1 Tax=Brachybacterium nesterenkovii TaxID=47847 RepID=A0A1X6WYR4_9MICO|nr:hypothetical protein [Brachybacterium nesterenkovii]SLM90977.1 hypothetical protein FM110_05960 [Brachybacterium nesterenkovii]
MTPDPDSLRSPVLLRAAACGAAIALALPLTGCMPGLGLGLGTKPDLAATVEGILAEVPHESVGAIAVDRNLVALTLVTADGPVVASREGRRDVVVQDLPEPLSWAVHGDAADQDLDAAALQSRMDALDCPDGAVGRSTATIGGAILQSAGCGPFDPSFEQAFIDGDEVPRLETWDVAAIDTVLSEARAIHGAEATEIEFTAAADGEGISATLLSAPQTRPDGSACVVRSTRRDSAPGAPHEILEHGLCEQSSSLSEGPVSLERVSGSTLDTALGLAEQEHGIPRDAVGSFRLMTKGGAPSLQVTPFPGATDDPSSVDIPLTV